MVFRAYKFKLEPTKEQIEKIEWTLNMCRWLYNSMLEQRRFAYKRRGISLQRYDQQKELPTLKKEIPEFKEIYGQVLQDVVGRVDFVFKGFFRRVKRGEKPGYPRFQGKNRYDSFTYPQAGFKIEGKFLKLSKIGNVCIKLHRQIEGKIKTCTIKRKNGKYYAILSCEVEPELSFTDKQVGVDLGVKHLAVTSDKEYFDHPKYLRKSERKLKWLQRMVSRRKKGSHRWRKAALMLAKCHEYVANQRKDTAHKISRYLVDNYDLIAFEDLNVQGMLKNRDLAKSIADAGWRMLVQFTAYKAEWAGKQVMEVDPRNTSQVCSECGQIVKKTLKKRTHRCSCGYVADRDVNAARNILHRAMEYVPEPKYVQLESNIF